MTPEEIVAAAVARGWFEGQPLGTTTEQAVKSLAALITEERAKAVRWCEGLARDEVPGTADEAADRIKRELPECFGEGRTMATDEKQHNKENSMDIINCNGRDFVAVDTLSDDQKPDIEDGGVRIVILQRGWVVVGHYHRRGNQVRVENAAVIRRWGTTKGLGELANSGPLSGTKLDDCPTVRCHELAVLATMDCPSDKWEGRL